MIFINSIETMFGIIIFDLGDGDASIHFVDQTRWNQILAIHSSVDTSNPDWKYDLSDIIGYLTLDADPNTYRPDNAPDRKGKLLTTLHTQTYSVEFPKVAVQGTLLGVLTFP